MRIAIIYCSYHHHNTLKVLETLKETLAVTLIPYHDVENKTFEEYDLIGFASGIYFNKFDQHLLNIIDNSTSLTNKPTFLLYTYGIKMPGYSKRPRQLLKQKATVYLGSFGCRGFDTYGVLKKIGGIAKHHPNERDFRKARAFINKITNKTLQINQS